MKIKLTALVIGFGIMAAFTVIAIRAVSGSVIGLESESFSREGSVEKLDDPQASGESFVQFSAEQTLGQKIAARKAQGLVVVGDSLLSQIGTAPGSGPIYEQKLISAGWDNLYYNSQGCRATGRSFCGTTSPFSFLDVMDEVINDAYDGTENSYNIGDLNDGVRQAGTMVIGLGTNDQPTNDQNQMEQRIRLIISKIRQLNPDIDLHWTLNCTAPQKSTFVNTNFNSVLNRIHQELDIELVNWAGVCNSSHVDGDQIHYNLSGVDAYGAAIVDGIEPKESDF